MPIKTLFNEKLETNNEISNLNTSVKFTETNIQIYPFFLRQARYHDILNHLYIFFETYYYIYM